MRILYTYIVAGRYTAASRASENGAFYGGVSFQGVNSRQAQ